MAFEEQQQREEISNKSEISGLLQELNQAVISFENYKKFFEKVQSSDRVIISQIENLTREYREYGERNKQLKDRDSYRQTREEGFVPVEVHENDLMMRKIVNEAMSWKTLQEEMYSIIFHKIFQVLDDARALDIKRDALKEMREMETQRQEMFVKVMENMGNVFKEAVISKLQSFDEKIFNFMMMNDEEHRKDRRDMFNAVRDMATKTSLTEQDKQEIFDHFGKEFKSVTPRVYGEEPDLWTTRKERGEEETNKDDDTGFSNFDDDEPDGNDDIDEKYNNETTPVRRGRPPKDAKK